MKKINNRHFIKYLRFIFIYYDNPFGYYRRPCFYELSDLTKIFLDNFALTINRLCSTVQEKREAYSYVIVLENWVFSIS